MAQMLVLVAGLALMSGCADRAEAQRPVLLMFHAGGFVFGSPELLDHAAAVARARGFATDQVAYPFGDPNAALRAARQATRRYPPNREIYAYGESAGGTLAARLAQGKHVDGAASYSPLADVTTFLDGRFADARRTRLLGRDSRVPVLALLARRESSSPTYVRDMRRWARSDRDVRLHRVPGDHLGSGGEYRRNMGRAVRWLARLAQG